MICEKCGKSNIKEESVCRYCGTKMPEAMESNGFADILSVNADVTSSNNHGDDSASVKKDDVAAQKLDRIAKKLNETIRATKRSLLVSYAAAGIGILALIISLVIGITATNNSDKRIKELEKKIEAFSNNTEPNDIDSNDTESDEKKQNDTDTNDTESDEKKQNDTDLKDTTNLESGDSYSPKD